MTQKLIILSLMLGVFIGCGAHRKSSVDENLKGIEVTDYSVRENQKASAADDALKRSAKFKSKSDDIATSSSIHNNSSEAPNSKMVQVEGSVNADHSGEQYYTTVEGDTLMLISFKIFGDYEKWRNLLEWNKDKIRNLSSLRKGEKLKFYLKKSVAKWTPEGNPYLIRKNETLGIISNNVYSTSRYWRDIWLNNKPLIKNPNIIFAGFTIFTPIINVGRSAKR
ncbi:LysM peptidoglycan-binding domain-containing protein [Bacteriovoracaceae bacterium]|nr:LysM peptidoglycan-binding domain-containing protein [Bacteriovoracaceae bacterium]